MLVGAVSAGPPGWRPESGPCNLPEAGRRLCCMLVVTFEILAGKYRPIFFDVKYFYIKLKRIMSA
jgi:hypothetical protein